NDRVPRCRTAMLQAVRAARWARILFLAAAFLAVAGSFGLHPEPDTLRPFAASASAWTATGTAASGAHDCFACLAHRSMSLARLSVFAPTAARSVGASVPLPARRIRLFTPRLDDGRAPPPLG
ncbi:MAG TPA: hypothetical protein VN971_02175, partial [Thermoanaerobaculia bacterium]|nr:hypothetical protein [Thermoanaerobaculia bacterium]